MSNIFYVSLINDLKAMLRNRAQWFHPILFFIIILSLFGIGLGFNGKELIKVSPAIIWISFLLTSLFTIETLFKSDQEEGIFEQLILSFHPLWWLLLAKSCAIWIVACLPLILIMPFVGLLMQLSWNESFILVMTMLLGSPALTLLGVMGAAITLALGRTTVFLGLLLLPLYVPILILGVSALSAISMPAWPLFQLSLLAAISVLAITLIPHAASALLKVAMD